MAEDARVRYTKLAIREGFLALLAETPFHDISVTEICRTAQVNRATFYKHYRSPYDLLARIESELFSEMDSKVVDYADRDLYAVVLKAFDVIRDNMDICRVILSENGDRALLVSFIASVRVKLLKTWKAQYPQASKQQLDYLFDFLINGAVAVMSRWVETGAKDIPEELGTTIKKAIQVWLK